jgi:GTPase SAR1 family protein
MAIAKELSLLKLAHTVSQFQFIGTAVKLSFSRLLGAFIQPDNDAQRPVYLAFITLLAECEPVDITKTDIAIIRKKYWTRTGLSGLFSPKICYKYLLLLGALYVNSCMGKKSSDRLTAAGKRLGVTRQEWTLLLEYINYADSGQTGALITLTQNAKMAGFARTVMFLTEFIAREYSYYHLPRIDVSVYATMSAGKSTFVNALLGYDYLPSCNAACTAKVTSIYDNDTLPYIIGYAVKKGKRLYNGLLNAGTLEAWNNDAEITEVILEGNLDNISNEGAIFVIHDTPGVNYSGDADHQKQTFQHLSVIKSALVLFLMDATQLHTSDFDKAFIELKKILAQNCASKVVFVLNKTDQYDTEKESLSTTLQDIAKTLGDCGFLQPLLVPVSAKAARLFKMALKNASGSFTEDEADDFSHFARYFSRKENDFNRMAIGLSVAADFSNGISDKQEAASIVIEGKSYSSDAIKECLLYTGVPMIEHILNTFYKRSEKNA